MLLRLILISLLFGCSGDNPEEIIVLEGASLTVTAPARGTTTDKAKVTVEGMVSADTDADATVMINGQAHTVKSNQAFSIEVAVQQGMNIVETKLPEDTDHRDVRAVLSGEFKASDASSPENMGLKLSPDAFTMLAATASQTLAQTDLAAPLRAANPIVETGGGCFPFNASINLNDIVKDQVSFEFTPTNGGLDFVATMTNIVISGDIDHKIACISGNDNYTMTADTFVASGKISISKPGDIVVEMGAVTADFTEFNFQLDSTVLNLIANWFVDVEQQVKDGVVTALQDEMPAQIEAMISDVTSDLSFDLFGTPAALTLDIADLTFDATGGQIDTEVGFSASAAFEYFSTPNMVPPAFGSPEDGMAVALEDDIINRILAMGWNQGALSPTIDASNINVLNQLADSVSLEMLLPPIVDATDNTSLKVGDLIVTAHKDGKVAFSVAVHLTADVSADVNAGTLGLSIENIVHDFQILEFDKSLVSEHILTSLMESLDTLVSGNLDDMLSGVSLPSIAGMNVNTASVSGKDGFLVLGAQF